MEDSVVCPYCNKLTDIEYEGCDNYGCKECYSVFNVDDDWVQGSDGDERMIFIVKKI